MLVVMSDGRSCALMSGGVTFQRELKSMLSVKRKSRNYLTVNIKGVNSNKHLNISLMNVKKKNSSGV